MGKVSYSVVIPYRNERKEVDRTTESIIMTQHNCVEINQTEDKEGEGTAPTRHRGVEKANSDIIITCDAHMRFAEGALDRLAEFIAAGPRRVGCLSCRNNKDLTFDGPILRGADLYEFGEYPFEAKWREPSAAVGEVPCVMGACYGFDRSFYAEIGEPWRLGRGWGCDEQFLAIPAHLCGGRVEVLAEECAHLYREPAEVAFRQTPVEFSRTWYTRFALLAYLNPDNAPLLRDSLARRAGGSCSVDSEVYRAAKKLELRQTVEFFEFRRDWLICDGQLEALAKQPKQKEKRNAKAAVRMPNPQVIDHGIRCPHCRTLSDRHRITTTLRNGLRRRLCVSCGMPFVSKFEVEP